MDQTYAYYVSHLLVNEMRRLLFFYTLKHPKTELTKSECRDILLSKYTITNNEYNRLTNNYLELPSSDKISLRLYKGVYYVYINRYMLYDEIAPRVAVNREQILNIEISKHSIPIIIEEMDTHYKKNKDHYNPSQQVIDSFNASLSNVYEEHIGKYNMHLRKLNNIITSIYTTISNYTVNEDLILFRGETYNPLNAVSSYLGVNKEVAQKQTRLKQLVSLKKNDIIENKSFVSCSLNPFVAMDFSTSKSCCLYRYFIKRGTCAFMCPYENTSGVSDDEFEILLLPHVVKILHVNVIDKTGKIYKELYESASDTPKGYTVFDVEIVNILPLPSLRKVYEDMSIPKVNFKK